MRRALILAACLLLSGSSFAKWPPSSHTGWTHNKGSKATKTTKTTATHGTTTGFYFLKR